MGAESNGIAIKEHIAYKDGLLPAVILLDIIATENKSIKQLIENLKIEMNYPCEVLEFAYPITKEKKTEIYNKVFKERIFPETPAAATVRSKIFAMEVPMVPEYFCLLPYTILSATMRPCLLAGPANGIRTAFPVIGLITSTASPKA